MLGLILKFIVTNWRFFAGAFIILGLLFAAHTYIEDVRKEGKEEGIRIQAEADKKVLDDLQARYDAKAAEFETYTRDLADSLTKSSAAHASAIASLDKKVGLRIKDLDTKTYKADGSADLTMSVYLGSAFSNTWNEYNKEVRP